MEPSCRLFGPLKALKAPTANFKPGPTTSVSDLEVKDIENGSAAREIVTTPISYDSIL